ncbi:MAG: hypothetical protein Q9187_001445 [Circinaria calcarea]
MSDSRATTATVQEGPNSRVAAVPKLDLTALPPVYVLPTHLSLTELHTLEDQLSDHGGTVTYDICEAKLVLGAITTAKRAKFELQCLKLRTEESKAKRTQSDLDEDAQGLGDIPPQKRTKLPVGKHAGPPMPSDSGSEGPSTASVTEDEDDPTKPMSQLSIDQVSTSATDPLSDPVEADNAEPPFAWALGKDMIRVVKIDWFKDSLKLGQVLKMDLYIIYEGKRLPRVRESESPKPVAVDNLSSPAINYRPFMGRDSFQDAITVPKATKASSGSYLGKRHRVKDALDDEFRGRSFVSSTQQITKDSTGSVTRPTHFLRETTSEHDQDISSVLPEMPQWVKDGKIYSCEWSTPPTGPNQDFVEQLKQIRLARILTSDEIGVRAYSSSIASIAAYPHKLSSTREILALPGCDQRIAQLFREWLSFGSLEAVKEFEADPTMSILRLFYNIWGVGATTARQFYFDKGWRDLDDIVENGWGMLSREQQIGVKYYDEFEVKIPRSEVEYIASVITYHAKQIVDDGIECVIVGGHRRGKAESGDVDVIISHREHHATLHLVTALVNALEKSGWITHCLTLQETNSHRDQQPLPLKSTEKRGSGFDTLDKALVVWQDPHWPTKEVDLAENPKAKNPNLHRRVDIIISPWRTVGCAVEGWTSGTTFQRDLRRYAKHMKGWKFDSSGVRERGTGSWVDLEKWANPQTRAKTWEEAERRVFQGFGLEYREPWERCTG